MLYSVRMENDSKKQSRRRSSWPARRAQQLAKSRTLLSYIRGVLHDMPKTTRKEHKIFGTAEKLDEIITYVEKIESSFKQLPDDFTFKKHNAKVVDYCEGSVIQIKPGRRKEYVGIFEPQSVKLKVVGPVVQGYVPVVTPAGAKLFIDKSHVVLIP